MNGGVARNRPSDVAIRRAISALAVATTLGLSVLSGSTSVDSTVMASPRSTPAPTQKPQKPRIGPFALLLVVDAARFDEFNLNQMPNLSRLVAAGSFFSNAWVGQLPSITETSHATLGTGVLPYRHGILGDTWRVPGTNQMAPDLLSAQLDRTGYIGKFIRQTGSPSFAGLVHQRYPGSIVVALSGHKTYAADAMGAGTADFVAFGMQDKRGHYVPAAIPGATPSRNILASPQLDLPSYPRKPGLEDWWTTTLAEKFLFKYHPRVMMVNFPEVDVFGHIAGTNARVMQPLISNIDRQIGRLVAAYARAGMLSQTDIVVTADHAMAPSVRTVSSLSINKIIQLAGGQPLYVGHGDYSPIWLRNVSAVPRVAAALARANLPGVAAIYAKTPAGRYVLASQPSRLADPGVQQAYNDLLLSFDSPESPDIVLLYDENTITMTPTFLKIGRKGDHGGATWGAQHIPLILEGPGVKQGYTSAFPARLTDIAPTLETLLGVTPQHQDGTPLADAMVSPPPGAAADEVKHLGEFTADVDHLEREAALRPNVIP